jgi:hypothetical protein
MDSATTDEEIHVKKTDVILGRGRGAACSRIGNIAYRHILWSLRTKYKATRRSGKSHVGRCVVEKIHRLGGRFLAQEPETKKYYLVSDEQAIIKACQALREKKVEKPAGFDHNVMKMKSKWIAKIENGPLTPPPESVSPSKNFKVSEMFSETLISALSGICSHDTLRVPSPSLVSDDSLENHSKFSGSKRQTHSLIDAAVKSNVTKYWSHPQVLTANTEGNKAIENTDMLRSLITDPFTSCRERRQAPIETKFDDTALSLPPHVKSFFKGLFDRYIPGQDSKDEEDWINIVTQTTPDFKDVDELGNDELSVILDRH